MPDNSFPVEVLGVPVVAAPEEIDITNAEALRSALLTAAAGGHGALVVDMTRTRPRYFQRATRNIQGEHLGLVLEQVSPRRYPRPQPHSSPGPGAWLVR
jgi:hypothetical protein